MMRRLAACSAVLVLAVRAPMVAAQDTVARPLTFAEIAALPTTSADHRIGYGPDSLQFGELRLPKGNGPFPTIVLIHGGCWLSQYDLKHTGAMAAALAEEGFAVWAIEYRRLGNLGGGWPNTFHDVARGADFLRELARRYPLDTARVVLVGHSAGGQFALWLAARHNLPVASAFATATPLRVRGVVSLAGVTDLKAFATARAEGCNSVVPRMMGGAPSEVPERYAQVSPIELVPLGVPSRLLTGYLDRTVTMDQASTFAERAHARGDDAQRTLLEREGHFDVLSPRAPAWHHVIGAIRSLLEDY
jgi:acetyl esterase/lipase